MTERSARGFTSEADPEVLDGSFRPILQPLTPATYCPCCQGSQYILEVRECTSDLASVWLELGYLNQNLLGGILGVLLVLWSKPGIRQLV